MLWYWLAMTAFLTSGLLSTLALAYSVRVSREIRSWIERLDHESSFDPQSVQRSVIPDPSPYDEYAPAQWWRTPTPPESPTLPVPPSPERRHGVL